jgi:hypothetical protein
VYVGDVALGPLVVIQFVADDLEAVGFVSESGKKACSGDALLGVGMA